MANILPWVIKLSTGGFICIQGITWFSIVKADVVFKVREIKMRVAPFFIKAKHTA